MLFAPTYDAAREYDGEVEFVALRNLDEPAGQPYLPTYLELISRLWRVGETFLILEHDIVPRAGMLKALADCPHHWCGHTYEPSGGYGNFGCAKIGHKLIDATRAFYEPGTPLGFHKHEQQAHEEGRTKLSQWERVHPSLAVRAGQLGHSWHSHGEVRHRATRHDPELGHPLGDELLELDEYSRPTVDRQPHAPTASLSFDSGGYRLKRNRGM